MSVNLVGTSDIQETQVFDGIELVITGSEVDPIEGAAFKLKCATASVDFFPTYVFIPLTVKGLKVRPDCWIPTLVHNRQWA